MRVGEYGSRLHLVGIATLVVITAALAAVGWSLRPASGGFQPVPQDFQLFFSQHTYSPKFAPGYELSLTRTGNDGAASLMIIGPGYPESQRWSLLVNNLGAARLCSPSRYSVEFGTTDGYPVPHQHIDRHPRYATDYSETYNLVGIDGSGQFVVRLCWTKDSPIIVNGAYLNARLPSVYSFATTGESSGALSFFSGPGPVRRELNLGQGLTTDYNVQSLVAPSSSIGGGWQWSARTPATAPIAFSAVNTSETQHDSYQAFLSGIVFGVAGGALVALIQELVAPFRARRDLRPPEPGG